MKECPICHAQYDDSLNFCTKDGHQLKSVETSHAETQKQEKQEIQPTKRKEGMLEKNNYCMYNRRYWLDSTLQLFG